VPRWLGDVNFMPLLAETKVISEHLDETYGKLRRHFAGAESYHKDTKTPRVGTEKRKSTTKAQGSRTEKRTITTKAQRH
jgi:hypothetical protein